MVSICLNMIVKNESKIIERMLKSVIDIIDYFVIIDTGSEDNTLEIIYNFFKNYHHVKGVLIKNIFIDFSTNRNRALKYCQGLGDYILLLDADHLLEFKLDKNTLKEDAYSLVQENDNYSCQNIRLIKNDNSFIYKGYTHEVLRPVKERNLFFLDKDLVKVIDVGDGGCKREKISRDIKLLKKEIKENPEDPRAYFYLANTYFSIKEYSLATNLYQKRIDLKGWSEEVYFCFLRLGIINLVLKDFKRAIYYLLEAYENSPKRCENLFYLREIYRLEKRTNLIKLLDGIIQNNLQYPKDSFLFHNKSIYKKL